MLLYIFFFLNIFLFSPQHLIANVLGSGVTPTPTINQPTTTPKPQATATPKPQPTATLKPQATATPKPQATVTPKPQPTVIPNPTPTMFTQPTTQPTAQAAPTGTASSIDNSSNPSVSPDMSADTSTDSSDDTSLNNSPNDSNPANTNVVTNGPQISKTAYPVSSAKDLQRNSVISPTVSPSPTQALPKRGNKAQTTTFFEQGPAETKIPEPITQNNLIQAYVSFILSRLTNLFTL